MVTPARKWVFTLSAAAVALASVSGTGAGEAATGASIHVRVRTIASLVLERDRSATPPGAHGPQICFVVRQSLPPQCGGPDIVGWDWSKVNGKTSVRGVTWGGPYVLAGTFDGRAVTLTAPPTPVRSRDLPGANVKKRFATPCKAPSGGWIPRSRSRGFAPLRQRVTAYAHRLSDLSAIWPDETQQRVVLNVRFAANVAAHRADLRARYPGNLCVVAGGFRIPQLNRTLAALPRTGMLSAAVDAVVGVVRMDVVYDDGTLQQTLDRRFGPGVVRVKSTLVRIP